MQLLLIRHADPDYSIDSLTQRGWGEAEALAKYLRPLPVSAYYVSPLGRARDTASVTLAATGRQAEEKEWLREFPVTVELTGRPNLQKAYPDQYDEGQRRFAEVVWDMLPEYWTEHPEYLEREGWRQSEVAACSDLIEKYDYVTGEMDRLLAEYGYRRNGLSYRVEKANRERLVFFCHFGVECVLLSHLLNISPFTLWHGMVAAPSSVTTINTEERRQGIACFRMARFGDISHLAREEKEPAFSARFCETFDSKEERH